MYIYVAYVLVQNDFVCNVYVAYSLRNCHECKVYVAYVQLVLGENFSAGTVCKTVSTLKLVSLRNE